MTNGQDKKPQPGDTVVLTEVPLELLNDLPVEDQHAITEMIGKAVLLNEYDNDGKAELQFTDRDGTIHFIYVSPHIIRAAK